MTRNEFMQALDRHGGRIDRWPHEVRDAARAFAAGDPAAARELARAAALEASLERLVAPADVDAAFVGRIVAGVQTDGRTAATPAEAVLRPNPRLFAFAGALAVATLMVGYVAGMSLPAETGDDAFAGLLFGSAYEDVGESIL